MILRTVGMAALLGAAVAALAGNFVPLAILTVLVMLSLPLLDDLGYHPTRGPRPTRNGIADKEVK